MPKDSDKNNKKISIKEFHKRTNKSDIIKDKKNQYYKYSTNYHEYKSGVSRFTLFIGIFLIVSMGLSYGIWHIRYVEGSNEGYINRLWKYFY